MDPASRMATIRQGGRHRPQDEQAGGIHDRVPFRCVSAPFGGWSVPVAGSPLLIPDVDLAALPQLLGAIHHDEFIGRQAGVDGRVLSMARADRDRSHRHRLVGLHHVDEGPLRPSLDGGGRHDRGPALDVQQQARIDELIGEQFIVVVREDRLQPHRAGVRIDLVVHGQQRSCGQFLLLLPIEGLDRQLFPGFELVQHGGRLSSAMVKITVIGWSCVMTKSPLVSFAWTMLPGSTRRNPMRPLMGAVMRE